MIKVLFICHGNICRSPMAEFILKDMVKKNNIEDDFIISSAATSSEEIYNGVGNPVYPPAAAELLKHGILCNEKRAVLLRKSDYEKYNLFLCMDSSNIRNAIRIFNGDKDNKVKKLLSYTGSNRDVSDPWYTRDFNTAYKDIYEGCKKFLDLYLTKREEL
jgi:protein-tyrosine phosphatase